MSRTAVWSAAGTVLVTAAAALLFGDRVSATTIAGMAVTVVGVAIINLSTAGE
jgi:small multidrug resistance pump